MNYKKLLKTAEFVDNPEMVQFETILDTQEQIEALKEDIKTSTDKICEDIYAIPQPQDNTELLNAILDKLNEPDEEDEITVTLNIV